MHLSDYQEGDEQVGEAEVDQQQVGRRVLQLLLAIANQTNRKSHHYLHHHWAKAGGPGWDRRTMMWFRQAHFRVFSTSLFLPMALTSDIFAQMQFCRFWTFLQINCSVTYELKMWSFMHQNQ